MGFKGEKGERFFRSTLVQTLFYGIFSAWVLRHEEDPARTDAFDWYKAAYHLHVPMIQSLFHQVANPAFLSELDLRESLDLAGALLNRVRRGPFFEAFGKGKATIYFYERFLEAFDPQLRYELGVWYTPPEIVRYMVERVDTVLKEEMGLPDGLPDGLADPNVIVLDPCCGTGAYLG